MNGIRFLIIILAFSSVLVFSKSNSGSSKVLAVVGNYKITLEQFSDRYKDYLVYSGVQDNIQLRYSILNNMVNEILLRNYDNNSRIYKNPEYKKEIKWAKKQTVLAFLKDREIYAKITAPENEIREAYRRSNIKLAVRHLYARTKKEADNLYHLLKIGVDFKKLAKQVFTDSILQNNGGYLGYITWGQTDPNFEDTAYSLNVGEISKPVRTAEGYSIIKLEDKIVDPLMTETDYLNKRHKIERGVKINKKKACENAYIKKIFGDNKIEYNNKSIENILNDLKNSEAGNIEFNAKAENIPYCVKYKGIDYSQKEIENLLSQTPRYNLEKIVDEKAVKSGILGLLMQKKLLTIAEEKGYDTTSYVASTLSKLQNEIYLKYKRNEILSQVNIPDSDLYEYYNENIAYYSSENEMNVQEILLQNPDTLSFVKEKLKEGEKFGELAEKYSLRKWSSRNKGEMGLAPVSNYGEFKDTLWNAPIGKIIGPFKIDKYFDFFKVIQKKDGKPVDFNLVKSQILYNVRNERGFPYMKRHIDSLSKKIDIKINEDILKNYSLNLAG